MLFGKCLRQLLASASLFLALSLSLYAAPGRAVFLDDELEVAKARLGFVRGETEEILATYFLFDGDKTGSIALAELRDAARRGVKVKLVIDGVQFASWADTKGLTPGLLRHLADEGVEIRVFNPVKMKLEPKFVLTHPWELLKWRPNQVVRNHEKLLILKKLRIVANGDRNMQNINFRKDVRLPGLSYRSVETFSQGTVGDQAVHHFNEDIWTSPWVYGLDLSNVTPAEIEVGKRRLDTYIKLSREKLPATSAEWLARMEAVADIKLSYDFVNPLDKNQKIPGAEMDLLEMIDGAKENGLIEIISPYIRLPDHMEKAVFRAIQERNVKVKILIPSRTTTDAPITLRAFKRQAKRLRKAGVEIFEHQGPDFLHAKLMIVDRLKVFIGSHNLNWRSWVTDYESGSIFTGESFAAKVGEFHEHVRTQESLPYVRPPLGPIDVCADLLLGGALIIPPVNRQL
nr:hypothetical protein [uncultured bacterium]